MEFHDYCLGVAQMTLSWRFLKGSTLELDSRFTQLHILSFIFCLIYYGRYIA